MTRRRKWMHRALVCFGILCGFISFVISVKDLAKAFSEGDATEDEAIEEVGVGEDTAAALTTDTASAGGVILPDNT